jgi:hypothetical protein
MVAFPLSILALASGIYLLVKVKREFLGRLFEVLSWLVVLLSLASIGLVGAKALHHCCGGGHCSETNECRMEKRIIIKDAEGHCTMDSSTSCAGHCPMMDSLGKEECMKKCHEEGKSCCAHVAGSFPMHHEGCKGDCGGKCSEKCEGKCESGSKACCAGSGEKKECCKKKM